MAGDHLMLVSFCDRLFDQALTSQYNLSIRIDPDGLSFSVYSTLSSRYLALESVIWNRTVHGMTGQSHIPESSGHAGRFLDSHPWLLKSFRQTVLILNSPVYTLVPHVLYNPLNKAGYLDFVNKASEPVVYGAHFLNSAEAWLVYALPQHSERIAEKYFHGARLMHHAGAMIETILPRYRHNEVQNPVFVNIRNGLFDVLVLKEGKLRYCNTFAWKVNEDLVYYLIFVLDQLALNPENVPLILTGMVEQTSPLYELLQRYIRHIDFLYNSEVSKSGIALSDSNEYKFFDLLNPGLCV